MGEHVGRTQLSTVKKHFHDDKENIDPYQGVNQQRFTNTNHSGNSGNNSNKTRTKERKPLQEIYIGTIPYASITTDTVQNNNNINILIDDCMKVKNQFVKQKSSSSSKKNNNKKKKASLKSQKTIQNTKANNLRRFR